MTAAQDEYTAISRFMADRGLNAASLASLAGFSASVLYNLKRGTAKSLSIATYEKIARAAGTGVADIMAYRDRARMGIIAMNDFRKIAIPAAAAPTMSSREIAELTGKRHDHVMRDIRNMLNELGDDPSFGGVYTDAKGESRPCYHLPKRETLILVSGYSVDLRARIIDRWQELEASVGSVGAVRIDVRDPSQLATIAIQLIEVNKELEHRAESAEEKVKAMAGDVAALDRIAKADGSMCITDAAKSLQVMPRKLFAHLRANAWIYRRVGSASDIAYQNKIAAGLMEHKTTIVARTDGTEKTVTQARLTPKGLARLAREFGKGDLLLDGRQNS